MTVDCNCYNVSVRAIMLTDLGELGIISLNDHIKVSQDIKSSGGADTIRDDSIIQMLK